MALVTRYTLLDLETVAHPSCDQWLSPIDADKRLTDPVKIADDLAKKKAAQLESAPLDPDLCQIVAFGIQPMGDSPQVMVCASELAEKAALETVWIHTYEGIPFLGYGLSWFDLGVLVRRSQLLGVRIPGRIYEQGKYRHPLIVDLADY